MKVEDSGMPNEDYWNSLFNLDEIIDWLQVPQHSKIAEIGCGYGTFSIPVAKTHENNQLLVFDIEQNMLEQTKSNVQKAKLDNVDYFFRDVVVDGTGLKSESINLVLLFNILHSEYNKDFLQEAQRILKPNGVVAVIHWRKDIDTPRGPDVRLRPSLTHIQKDCQDLNLEVYDNEVLLGPYHWGIKLIKKHET